MLLFKFPFSFFSPFTRDYSYLTATYFLLLDKKSRGQSVLLTPNTTAGSTGSPLRERSANLTPKRILMNDLSATDGAGAAGSIGGSPRALTSSLEGGLDDIDLLNIGSPKDGNKEAAKKKSPLVKFK